MFPKIVKAPRGLPWWLSGEELAGQCRRPGFDPWPGRIPRAMERLSWWATTTEPAVCRLCAAVPEGHTPWSLGSATGEALAVRNLLPREKPTQPGRPSTAKSQ